MAHEDEDEDDDDAHPFSQTNPVAPSEEYRRARSSYVERTSRSLSQLVKAADFKKAAEKEGPARMWGISVSNQKFNDEPATQVELVGPDVVGLLAAMTEGIFALGLDVTACLGQGSAKDGEVKDIFHVHNRGRALTKKELPLLEGALHDTLARLAVKVAASHFLGIERYVVTLEDVSGDMTVVTVKGPDVPGLLNTITSTLTKSKCSVLSFSGETTKGGQAVDMFTVAQHGEAIDTGARAAIVSRLKNACGDLLVAHEAAATDDKAPPSKYNVEVSNGGSDEEAVAAGLAQSGLLRVAAGPKTTTVWVTGPDVPGLLNMMTNALAIDGYSIHAFKASALEDAAGGELQVGDVFTITRDGAQLSAKECLFLQTWLTTTCDRACAAFERSYE